MLHQIHCFFRTKFWLLLHCLATRKVQCNNNLLLVLSIISILGFVKRFSLGNNFMKINILLSFPCNCFINLVASTAKIAYMTLIFAFLKKTEM